MRKRCTEVVIRFTERVSKTRLIPATPSHIIYDFMIIIYNVYLSI